MIDKPYRRIIRPFSLSTNVEGVSSEQDPYLQGDPFWEGSTKDHYFDNRDEYAPEYTSLIRAYRIIEKDLIRILDFIEPSNANLSTYSHRLYEILLRACTEFETNCKGILEANEYSKSGYCNISDYCKINASSRLSDYELRIGIWHDDKKTFRPFSDWAEKDKSLSWYQDYNTVKHNRSGQFKLAKLENVLMAISGVLVLLFSQFHFRCFCVYPEFALYQLRAGWYASDHSIFEIKPPQNWTEDEHYNFDWSKLSTESERFGTYGF